MRKSLTGILILMVIGIALPVTVLALPARPQPQRLVNDLAGIFTPSQTYSLERTLVEFDDSTSNQIAVVTVNDLEGYEPDDYATRLGLEWKVGSAQFNNGIVVLVKPKTASSGGRVAISIGYGLEGAIPDAYAKRIIENEMIPAFRNGDYYSGVERACIILMKLAKGEYDYAREDDGDEFIAIIGFLIIAFVIFIIILIASSSHKGGGGGNGGSSSGGLDDITKGIIIGNILNNSGGGFGRAGGSFGRGGFGGFGGGSFGGGGAKGSW